MGKLPAFQFYPADWLNDIKLQSCNMAAQGILIGMMCLMHQSDRYGYLMINGLKPNDKTIIKLLRTHHRTFIRGVNQLLLSGALKKTMDGIYYCKRMVKDHTLRTIRRDAGRKGGNPVLLNQGVNQDVNLDEKKLPPPSSSSSSSSSKNNPSIPFQEIIEYLNKKSGKNFKWQNKKTQGQIRARWKEGSTLEDFKHVIDIKCQKWLSDPEMADFVRPVTLFGTKFEGYKNESRPKPKSRLIS